MTSKHPYLTIETTSAPGVQTIVLASEADLAGTAAIEAAIEQASLAESPLVVVDLRNLTFIDSSGLQSLIRGHEHCLLRGHEMQIIPGPANVQRLFELTGMVDVLPFAEAE